MACRNNTYVLAHPQLEGTPETARIDSKSVFEALQSIDVDFSKLKAAYSSRMIVRIYAERGGICLPPKHFQQVDCLGKNLPLPFVEQPVSKGEKATTYLSQNRETPLVEAPCKRDRDPDHRCSNPAVSMVAVG